MTDVRGKPTNPPTVKNGQEDMTRRVSFKRKSQKYRTGTGDGPGPDLGPELDLDPAYRPVSSPVPSGLGPDSDLAPTGPMIGSTMIALK